MATADSAANSIAVTVRVRPFTIREAAQLTKCDDGPLFLGDGSLAAVPTPKLAQKGIRPVIKVVDDRCLVFDPPEDNPVQRFSKSVVPTGRRVKDQTFAFDKVFDENTTQADVYEATTKNLLDSVLDGYNATVFAYGATGCGKTHTITGTVQQPGIIFLTMQELFERISEVQGDKVTEISLSYLEIYNETIRDLLVPGGSKGGLMLREDANQAVSVAGLSSHHPQNVQEVMDMIVRGNEYRTMSPTEANATSSRSHAVLQINVSQKDRNADVNEPHTMATLSIIDLAGSERASATKNRGERLIEGANINRSLLALGSCINALCDPRKRNHVPYRNSKLTRLLKFSLGGNCRTVMIVCVSPSSAHFDETQNTLRYANRAKNIQTKVTRNVYNVNRHVKDFLKKIDEQMAMINELKEQQRNSEGVAFAKFRKQSEKRDAIAKEGIMRLRSAYDHSAVERQERINTIRKLRQIERRISVINSWTAAFDDVCEIREDEEPSRNLTSIRKVAIGTLAELEESRQHCHRRLAKDNWQRAIDTALQIGLKQLQDIDSGTNGSEAASLTREAELLKSNFERDLHSLVLDDEKDGDASFLRVLLHSVFETVAILGQLIAMEEQDAVQAARKILHDLVNSCSNAAGHLIKQDGGLQIIEAVPPTRMGTPKRRKKMSLMGPSPPKPQFAPVALAYLNSSPVKTSPMSYSPATRRVKLGATKSRLGTPRKRSPKKKLVQWRDDTEDGRLADFSKTPVKLESTPEQTDVQAPAPDSSSVLPQSELSSSPIPAPPQPSMDLKPVSHRFQTGFLSRKNNDSPAPPTLTHISSSPEPSPLQELANNTASGRLSGDGIRRRSATALTDSHGEIVTSSDSEQNWQADRNDMKEINKAMKRASLSRSSSVRESTSRPLRRRSPQTALSGDLPNENGLFTSSHARRMVKSEKDVDWKVPSVLSPRTAPIVKGTPQVAGRRITTAGDERGGVGQRSASRVVSGGRLSTVPATGSAGRGSIASGAKIAWRFA